MPRGREPEGEAPLSNAERQARYRVRHKEKQASVIVRPLRPVDRRSRLQRWHAAPASAPSANASAGAGSAELGRSAGRLCRMARRVPEPLRGTATAEALQAIIDLDLEVLAAIEPPRGYGRD
jgi:hypothetical protein